MSHATSSVSAAFIAKSVLVALVVVHVASCAPNASSVIPPDEIVDRSFESNRNYAPVVLSVAPELKDGLLEECEVPEWESVYPGSNTRSFVDVLTSPVSLISVDPSVAQAPSHRILWRRESDLRASAAQGETSLWVAPWAGTDQILCAGEAATGFLVATELMDFIGDTDLAEAGYEISQEEALERARQNVAQHGLKSLDDMALSSSTLGLEDPCGPYQPNDTCGIGS